MTHYSLGLGNGQYYMGNTIWIVIYKKNTLSNTGPYYKDKKNGTAKNAGQQWWLKP